jgi:hypothetical protein
MNAQSRLAPRGLGHGAQDTPYEAGIPGHRFGGGGGGGASARSPRTAVENQLATVGSVLAAGKAPCTGVGVNVLVLVGVLVGV